MNVAEFVIKVYKNIKNNQYSCYKLECTDCPYHITDENTCDVMEANKILFDIETIIDAEGD